MKANEIAHYANSSRKVVLTIKGEKKQLLGTFQIPLQPSKNKWGFLEKGTSYEFRGRTIENIDFFDEAHPVTGKKVETKKRAAK
jgi:hypothetical protein